MKKFTIKKLFFIFLLFIISIIIIIGSLTIGPASWQAVKHIQIRYLLLAVIVGLFSIFLDSLVLIILSQSVGTKIHFFYSLEIILSYYFLSSITPTVTGGEPLMIYMLTEKDMPSGKATAVIIIRGFLILSIIALAAPIIIYFHGEFIRNEVLKDIFYSIAFFISFLVCLITYTLFNPIKGEKIIHMISFLVQRVKIIAHYSDKVEKKLYHWIDDFRTSLKEFFAYKKKNLLLAVIVTGASICANYFIASVILRGLNYSLSVIHIFMIQFILYFLLYFSPTPGGTGVAEGASYVMFASAIPDHLIGIFIILWRFFTVYFWVFIGGLIITRTIGLDFLDEITTPHSDSDLTLPQ